MKNIKLIIEYDGTNYFGWQKQPNALTVQGKLEETISKLTGEALTITGCSRTDSKVHAKAFVANFFTGSTIPPEKFKYVLNHCLPEDIVILSSEEAADDFHSRYSSIGKTYSYTIINREERIAIGRNYAYVCRKELDTIKMQEAAEYLLGKHDFAAFRNLGSSVKTTVRTIHELKVFKESDNIKIIASADGFLYNMVRIIAGTLIEAGAGKRQPADIKDILLSLDRTNSGAAAPPQGLCLEKVYY